MASTAVYNLSDNHRYSIVYGPYQALKQCQQNVNSKKSDSYRLFTINRHVTRKNDIISEKLHFHFLGEYSKRDSVKN